MSGFAGMISLNGAPPDRALLERMAARLAFRGPDGTHITTQPGAGFCFTFLRTGPAPQCPSQPCSLDGRVWLLGDVRLDGRDDVRRKLEQHGDTLATDATDEELVLRVWQRWGEDGIAELIGDYAFALWDAEARVLRCWRDLMGARPFFYAQAGGWFYFSNTLDTVRRAPGMSPGLDHDFIRDFLVDGWNSDGARTAFRQISRLPSGHILRHSAEVLEVRRYTSLPLQDPLWLKREDDYVEHFRYLLEEAVLDRLPRSTAAIFLSGGMDSTSIAAIALHSAKKRHVPLQLHAFTADCRPLFDDPEPPLAIRLANHLNIPIEILSHARWLPFQGWKEGRVTMPEPCWEPYWAFYRDASMRISSRARVVLNGYGGDGILTGQTWPYLISMCRQGRVAKLGMDFAKYFLRHRRFPPLRGGFRSGIRRLWPNNRANQEYPEWLSPAFQCDSCLPNRSTQEHVPRQNTHPWYPNAWATLDGEYWASTQECEDSAWTGAPTESRAPLLDVRIQTFLLRVPPVPLCIDKQLLRRAMEGLLPDEIRSRPKTPLLGDPLRSQINRGQWSPLPLPHPVGATAEFVDFRKLSERLKDAEISSSSRELRPLLLHYWLAEVEKNWSIK